MSIFVKTLRPLSLISGILLFLISCNDKREQKIDYRAFVDYRFRKIQMYLDDSARYFRAVDSIYADLPAAKKTYEVYTCKQGYFRSYKRDPARALEYADSMLRATQALEGEAGYPFWHANALFCMADNLTSLKRFREALRYYFLAREAVYATGDTCLYSEYSERLAMMAYRQKSYGSAATYFKQAYEQREKCEVFANMYDDHVVFSNQQATLDNIGLCYAKLGLPDSAIVYYDSALTYIEKNYHYAFRFVNDQKVPDTDYVATARAVIYGNKAGELIKIKKYEEAEALLNQSIQMNSSRTRAIEDVPYSLAKLSDLYLQTGRLPEAEKSIGSLRAILDTMPNAEMLIKWHLLKSNLEQEKGNMLSSIQNLNKYVVMRDSLEALVMRVQASDIDNEFDHLRMATHLNKLQKADTRKNAYLIIAAISLVFCLLVAFLIYYNYSQSRMHLKALASLNENISQKNADLEQALSDLQVSQEEKNRLLKVVAHDLRNPIGGIAAATEFLLKSDNYTEVQRQILQTIHTSSLHSTALIADLMQERKHSTVETADILNLQDLVRYCVDVLKLPAANKEQQLVLNDAPAVVKGDKEKLWRVFSNLIGNAIKFSPEGKLINIDFSLDKNSVTVAVKDQGIGLPDNIRENLFTATQDGNAKREGTNGEQSYGLGLRICKEIVEDHDGRIWAESNPQKGAAFYVSLPLAV